MLIIGLTGSLATGKSSVAGMLRCRGAKVFDADKIAHRLLKSDKTCVNAVIRKFGKDVLTHGTIDRKKLADIVFKFKSEKKLAALTRVIHPAVIREIKRQIKQFSRKKARMFVVIDAPLLIEAGWDQFADLLIVVKTDRRTQIQRARKAKGLSRAKAVRRIKMQMPLREKIKRADIIIDNTGTLSQTERQVEAVWQRIVRIKQKK